MISQVHSNYNLRIRIIGSNVGKCFGIFIKDITHKMKDESNKTHTETTKAKDRKIKKWEPKNKVKFQTSNTPKIVVQEKNSASNSSKEIVLPTIQWTSTLGMLLKPTVLEPIDMISMLSQIIVKVPLYELFRIEEHKSKALSWLGGIGNHINMVEPSSIQQTLVVVEDNGIISQI